MWDVQEYSPVNSTLLISLPSGIHKLGNSFKGPGMCEEGSHLSMVETICRLKLIIVHVVSIS